MVKKSGYLALALFVVALIIFLSTTFVAVNPPEKVEIADSLGKEIIKSFSQQNKGDFVVVDKGGFTLSLYQHYIKMKEYKVTIGKKHGNKRASGDDRTPEGIFRIQSIERSSYWEYDFPDDTLPALTGAYGPWFIRLDVPGFHGIGIHGFLNDDELGKRKSNGCIRLNNKKLEELVQFIRPGMPVIIEPSPQDLVVDRKNESAPNILSKENVVRNN
ncbi:MAG TPA: L,D-transpeptidase [Bacteroidetes bacterium]|nr:L,D-transpeptidase [Bacteroidota bacterium]